MTRLLLTRRAFFATGLASLGTVALGSIAGCQGDGNFCFLGYTTAPPYDPNIRSVYIPVFKNVAFVTTPNRGIEVDLTEAIVQELNTRKTPIRVQSDPAKADTELVGTIVGVNKLVLNRDRANYARQLEYVITVEVAWRDLRTGRALNGVAPPPPPPPPFDPSLPVQPPPPPPATILPLRVTGRGRFLPELGESNATGMQMAIKDLAKNIVNMMESPW